MEKRESGDARRLRKFLAGSEDWKGKISWKRAPLDGESFEDWYLTRNVLDGEERRRFIEEFWTRGGATKLTAPSIEDVERVQK